MVPLIFNLLMIQWIHWGPASHLMVSNGHPECLPASRSESQLPLRGPLWTLPVIAICAACVIRLALSHNRARVHTGKLAIWSQASPFLCFMCRVAGAGVGILTPCLTARFTCQRAHRVKLFLQLLLTSCDRADFFCPSGKEKNDTKNRYCNKKQWV